MRIFIKKTSVTLSFLPLIMNLNCINKQKNQELRKLTEVELLDRAHSNNLFPKEEKLIIYRDSNSNIIPVTELEKLPKDVEWTLDYYVDYEDNLKEYVIRKATKSDIILKDSINRIIEYNHVKKIDLLNIDCSQTNKILTDLFKQANENELQIVISILENCGIETLRKLNPEHLNKIWLTLQHNDNFYRKKYFKHIKTLVTENLLDKSVEATMQDRILVQDGKKQIYGTQVVLNETTKKWEICPILEPEKLNERRKKMNLEPINEYLKHWNLEYKFE